MSSFDSFNATTFAHIVASENATVAFLAMELIDYAGITSLKNYNFAKLARVVAGYVDLPDGVDPDSIKAMKFISNRIVSSEGWELVRDILLRNASNSAAEDDAHHADSEDQFERVTYVTDDDQDEAPVLSKAGFFSSRKMPQFDDAPRASGKGVSASRHDNDDYGTTLRKPPTSVNPRCDPAPNETRKLGPIVDINEVNFDEDDVGNFDFNSFVNHLGPRARTEDPRSIARTAIQIAASLGVPGASSVKLSGKTITDFELTQAIHTLVKRESGWVHCCMLYLQEAVSLSKSSVSYENFFSRPINVYRFPGSKGEITAENAIIFNGEWYATLADIPRLHFSKSEPKMIRSNPGYAELWSTLALLITSSKIRHSIDLPYWNSTRSVEVIKVWQIDEMFAEYLPVGARNLHETITLTADKIYVLKKPLIGYVKQGEKKVRMTLFDFIALCLGTMKNKNVEFQFDRAAWRKLRKDTVFDGVWGKNPYLLAVYGTDGALQAIPYNNTVNKFIDAMLNLLPLLKGDKFANKKVLVLYGGVTTSGRNTQLEAADYFFTELFGERQSVGRKFDNTKNWDLVKFDLNGNHTSGTLAVDLASIDSIRKLNAFAEDYERVIMITDTADSSVTAATNAKAGVWISNVIAAIPNITFITMKYCCASPITVTGAGAIIPLKSKMFLSDKGEQIYNVGRSHGAEGIVYVTPKTAKEEIKAKTLLPFRGKDKDTDYEQLFRDRCYEGSFDQLRQRPFYFIRDEWVKYFPKHLGIVAGLTKGGQETESEILDSWNMANIDITSE